MIARVLTRLLFALVNVVLLVQSENANTLIPTFLVQLMIGAGWIAYFRRSERVKNTFTR